VAVKSSSMDLYLDSILQNSTLYPGGSYGLDVVCSGRLGRRKIFHIDIFKGLIDEVRIYNRALSDSEIKALYEATK
jgi:hypothetical protein